MLLCCQHGRYYGFEINNSAFRAGCCKPRRTRSQCSHIVSQIAQMAGKQSDSIRFNRRRVCRSRPGSLAGLFAWAAHGFGAVRRFGWLRQWFAHRLAPRLADRPEATLARVAAQVHTSARNAPARSPARPARRSDWMRRSASCRGPQCWRAVGWSSRARAHRSPTGEH